MKYVKQLEEDMEAANQGATEIHNVQITKHVRQLEMDMENVFDPKTPNLI